MVDQRVAVALRLCDRGVAMALIGVDRVCRLPVEQDREPLTLELALELARLVADQAGIAQQEVQPGGGRSSTARAVPRRRCRHWWRVRWPRCGRCSWPRQ